MRLEDGDTVELGNTVIRAYDTPGHSIGCQSHFWTAYDGEESKKVGIYGGAGFSSLSTKRLTDSGMSLEWQQIFLRSVDHVYDEEVDITLGNHPFHNDTFEKHEKSVAEGVNAFIDSTEWHRSLDELKTLFAQFLEDEKQGISRAHESHYLKFRDICTPYLDHPEWIDRDLIEYGKYYE